VDIIQQILKDSNYGLELFNHEEKDELNNKIKTRERDAENTGGAQNDRIRIIDRLL